MQGLNWTAVSSGSSKLQHLPSRLRRGKAPLAIDECVEDELPVLLHQVVDVAKDSAVEAQQSAVFDFWW